MSNPHSSDDALGDFYSPMLRNQIQNPNPAVRAEHMYQLQQQQQRNLPQQYHFQNFQQQQQQQQMQHQQQLQQQSMLQRHQQQQQLAQRYYDQPAHNQNPHSYQAMNQRQPMPTIQQQERAWANYDSDIPSMAGINSGYHHQPIHRDNNFSFNVNAHAFVPRRGGMEDMYDPYQKQRFLQQQQQQQQYSSQQPQYSDYPQQNSQFQGVPTFQTNHSSKMMHQFEDQGFDAFAQFGQQSQQYMPSKELYDEMIDCNAANLLNEIQVGCEQLLTESEDDAGTWSTAIRQRFEDKSMDSQSKKVAVKLIVEMAYSMEPNTIRSTDPQYTYACLIQTLGKEIPDLIRDVILPVLQHYHVSRNLLENDLRVFLAIFFAEIFLKVTLGNGSRIEKLGNALCEQMDDIMKFPPRDEYMKCMMRVLKISGAELDDSVELRPRVDAILTRMGGFANGSHTLSEVIKAQILSLIDCRQRGWDRAPVSRSTNCVERYHSEADESIEGLDLTEDERNFLESQISALEEKDGGEPEIDEREIETEFGKFVKEELERGEEQKTSELMEKLKVCEDDEEPRSDA